MSAGSDGVFALRRKARSLVGVRDFASSVEQSVRRGGLPAAQRDNLVQTLALLRAEARRRDHELAVGYKKLKPDLARLGAAVLELQHVLARGQSGKRMRR